jgi:phosphatidylglycerol:prolipoprotein diacylglycerol transferase
MHPIFLKIFGLTITYYGLFVATGVITGLVIARKLAYFFKMDGEKIFDLGILIIIFSMIGARIFYIFLNWTDFLDNPMSYIFSRAGFVFLGGVIGGTAFGIIYALIKKLKIGTLADIFVSGLAIGHAIGRQGCLLNGCCYGKRLDQGDFFATYFFTTGDFRIPTQLYESLAEIVIFFILIQILKRRKFSGQVFISYVIFYGIWRFFLEFLRGDFVRYYFLHLTFSQVILIFLLPILFVIYFILKKYDKV